GEFGFEFISSRQERRGNCLCENRTEFSELAQGLPFGTSFSLSHGLRISAVRSQPEFYLVRRNGPILTAVCSYDPIHRRVCVLSWENGNLKPAAVKASPSSV